MKKSLSSLQKSLRETIGDSDNLPIDTLGLFESDKLSFINRALSKDSSRITNADLKAINEVFHSLTERIISEEKQGQHLTKFDPKFEKTATDKDLPAVIILKRKAIRVYPDHQKVGLYYSQALDKYVSIPFGDGVATMSEAVIIPPQSPNRRYVRKPGTSLYDKKTISYAGILGDPTQKAEKKLVNKSLRSDYRSGGIDTATMVGVKAGQAIAGIAGTVKNLVMKEEDVTPPVKTFRDRAREILQKKKDNIAKTKDLEDKYNKKEISSDDLEAHYKDPENSVVNPAEKIVKHAADIPDKELEDRKSGADNVATAGSLLGAGGVAKGAAAVGALALGARAASKGIGVVRNAGRGIAARVAARRAAKTAAVGAAAGAAATTGAGVGSYLGSVASGAGASSGDDRKYLKPGDFRMKVNVNSPRRHDVPTGVDARERSLYRKSLQITNENSLIDNIKSISEGTEDKYVIFGKRNRMNITPTIAKKMISLHETLSTNNKKKMNEILIEGTEEEFKKIINFSMSQ